MTEENKFEKEETSEVSLVPLYAPLDVSRGLQAHRRGDVILYTVRGEPEKVRELINELDGRGVNELVALVSHRAGDKTVEEVSDAIVKTEGDETAENEKEEEAD